MTVGNVVPLTTNNTAINTWWPYEPYDFTRPYTNGWNTSNIYITPQPPLTCDGNTHVFGCDHAEKCKCGKAKRKAEPPTCGHCGKQHS